MYMDENSADKYILSKLFLNQKPSGGFYENHPLPSCLRATENCAELMGVPHLAMEPESLITRAESYAELIMGAYRSAIAIAPEAEINFSSSETSEFKALELITDFSGEPYEVLKPIPATIRSLDGRGFEAAFVEGNIAWVDDSRVAALNGLKVEILDTIESFEADEYRLGPEPKRQLTVLRKHLKHTP